jgi:hypothetical protein
VYIEHVIVPFCQLEIVQGDGLRGRQLLARPQNRVNRKSIEPIYIDPAGRSPIVIPSAHKRGLILNKVQAGARISAVTNHISQTVDLVDAFILTPGEDGFERLQVPVNV